MTGGYLLPDVFKKFRDMIRFYYYGLDPAYYVMLPNYSWNAFLYIPGKGGREGPSSGGGAATAPKKIPPPAPEAALAAQSALTS